MNSESFLGVGLHSHVKKFYSEQEIQRSSLEQTLYSATTSITLRATPTQLIEMKE